MGHFFILYKYIAYRWSISLHYEKMFKNYIWIFQSTQRPTDIQSSRPAVLTGTSLVVNNKLKTNLFTEKSTLSDHHNHSIFDHIDVYLENNNKPTWRFDIT